MKLNTFVMKLVQFMEQNPGAGDMQVLYTHGASGECGPLSTAHITDEVGEAGPFHLAPNEKYVSIYAGN